MKYGKKYVSFLLLSQELLYTLIAMDESTDRGVRESSKVIKSNVFYVPEYRETILSQLLNFDELKMSRFVHILLHRCLLEYQKVFHHKYKQRNDSMIHERYIMKYYSSRYKHFKVIFTIYSHGY